jgi:hypothetical protein
VVIGQTRELWPLNTTTHHTTLINKYKYIL